MNEIPIPDGIFYYVLSGLMGAALIWIFQKYLSKLDRTIEKLVESDIKQNVYIENHDERIEKLESDGKLVKYKKAMA
jgi:hypothetical protein